MKVRRIVRKYEDVMDLPDVFVDFNEGVKEDQLLSDNVILLCHELIGDKAIENMLGLYFQPDGSVVDFTVLGVGNSSYVQATPFSTIAPALIGNTSLFVACHNHPGSYARPSDEDIEWTNTMFALGKMFYVHMLDHVIVNCDGAFSVRKGISYEISDGKVTSKKASGDKIHKLKALSSIKQAREFVESLMLGDIEDIKKLHYIFSKAEENMGLAPKEVERIVKKEHLKEIEKYKRELEKQLGKI
jgi:hypothetical protein